MNTTANPITTTYTLSVTTPQGCPGTSTVAVTVNPRPTAEAIFGPASVCPTVTGVAYSVVNPSGTAYQWLVNGGTIASGQGTSAITVNWGTANAAANVKLFRLNSFGCSSDTTTLPVRVNQILQTARPTGPGAVPAAGVCQANGPYTYQTILTNGSSYSWVIVGGTQVSTSGSSVVVNWNPVTVPTIGKIVVTETSDPAGGRCLGTSDTLYVNINPSPRTTLALTGPARVCQNSGPVTYSLPGGFAGSAYVFQVNGTTVTSTGNTVVLPSQTAAGTLTITARETTAAGCAGPLYTATLVVSPTPAPIVISGSGFVCNIAQTQQYTVANAPMGSTFQWTVTGGTVTAGQGTATATVQFNGTGPFTVSATESSSFSCVGSAASRTVLLDNPSVALALASVEVTTNNRVNLTLSSPNSNNTPNRIRVMRRVAGSGAAFTEVGTVATSATTFADNTADAALNSYEYRLELTNGCGTLQSTVVSQTVRLAATADQGTGGRNQGGTALTWNAYVGFPVQEYRILRRDDNGTATQVGSVAGNVLTFKVPNQGSGFNQCYRIVAVGAGALLSNSNEACVDFKNALNFYNVITPNGDGLNDVLEIDNVQLYPGASFTIFNRWGREVYNTTNYRNNWGMDPTIAPGVYYYLFKQANGTSSKGWVEVVKDK